MKKYLLLTISAAALLGLPACTTVVEDRNPRSTSTTTTETTAVRSAPMGASSTTVRSYR